MPCHCWGTTMTLVILVGRCRLTRIGCIIPTGSIWPLVVVVLSKSRLPVVMIIPIPTPMLVGGLDSNEWSPISTLLPLGSPCMVVASTIKVNGG